MSAVIKATKREVGSRSKLNQLRKNGKLAGVLYGFNTESTPILLDYKEAEKVVRQHGYAAVFQIELDGKTVNAILTEIQRDAIKGFATHVDFLAINMKEEIELDVPVSLVGTSAGVKEGGIITQPNNTITIKEKPANIPEVIELDVSKLNIGESLFVSDIRDQFTFDILNEDDYELATVLAPTVASDEEEPTEEAQEE